MRTTQRIDLTGCVYGDLTVLEGTGRPLCLVRCICGKEFMADAVRMKRGQRTNCGCMRAARIRERSRMDYTGQQYGKLTCIDNLKEGGKRVWQCECGKTTRLFPQQVISGQTRSCGCLRTAQTETCVICGKAHVRHPANRVAKPTCSRACFNKLQRTPEDELLGHVFDRLTVVSFGGIKGKQRRPYWNCLCSCGNTTCVADSHLKAGATRSCGCRLKEASSVTAMANCIKNTHGASSNRWFIEHNGRLLRLRSGFELIYAQYLIANKVTFQYEPQYFKLANGVRYMPDFYLPETDEYIEVKGLLSPAAEKKIALFPVVTGKKLRVLFQDDIKKLLPAGESLGGFYAKLRAVVN